MSDACYNGMECETYLPHRTFYCGRKYFSLP